MKVSLVSDSGGHLTELLQLEDAFSGHETFLITFTEVFTKDLKGAYLLREYRSFVLTCITVFFRTFLIFLKERPKVIVSTGSYIAIPVFLLGKFFFGAKLIYVESVAQVCVPSMTGRIAYWLSDLFLIQWDSLLDKYGKKARFAGGLI